MKLLSVRPKIAELVYQFFGRSLHPELFETFDRRRVERGGYTVTVDITSAGHVVCWQYEGLTLTEVATSAHHPLPENRLLLKHRLMGSCQDEFTCRGGVSYSIDFSLEPVDREAFGHYQRELADAGTREGLLHVFESSGRLGLEGTAAGAMSYVNLQSRDKTLRVQAFHTFPDDLAIVKTQSWFRLP